MPIAISEFLGIDHEQFLKTGALDAILDVDTKLFIDPLLLRETQTPELKASYGKVCKRFEDILRLLRSSTREGDTLWRTALRFLMVKEPKGLCIGYSSKSTSGSALGHELATRILSTAKEIIDAGIKDPAIFEIVGLLESDVGPDRISDLIADVIQDDLMAFSARVLVELGIPDEKLEEVRRPTGVYKLIRNPHNKTPIIFVPRDILRDLPIAYDWDGIANAAWVNESVRQSFNAIVGETWRDASRMKKDDLRDILVKNPALLDSLLRAYKGRPPAHYDFESDPAGQIIWYFESKRVVESNPLPLTLSKSSSPDDVLKVVLTICAKFKDLIENNALYTLLYDSDGRRKNEEAAQKVFYGIADAYCAANNVDLSREVNGGRGPVDFKFSGSYSSRIVVEAKLTSNGKLIHGCTKQLDIYQKAEKTQYGVYLVIDVDGGVKKRYDDLKNLVEAKRQEGQRVPSLVFVDGRQKPSASKSD